MMGVFGRERLPARLQEEKVMEEEKERVLALKWEI